MPVGFGGYGPYLTGNPPSAVQPMRKKWVTNDESGLAHLIETRGYGNPHAKCSLPPFHPWTSEGVDDKQKCGLCLEWEQDHVENT